MNARAVLRTVLVVCLVLITLLYAAVELALGFGVLTKPGVTFDLRSGAVTAVRPGSPAATAGVRVGDRADFARGGWQLHLALGRAGLYAGRETTLPLVRGGKPIVASLMGPPMTAPPDAWAYFLNVVSLLAYTGLGALLYALRRNAASLVFFALACAYSLRVDNVAILLAASPSSMPLAMLLCSVASVGPEMFGLLYFGLLFANDAAWTATARRYVLIPAVVIAALYYYHFFGYTVWAQPFDTYLVYSILTWVIFAVAATAITARMNRDPNPARLRWVAVGLWTQAFLNAAFLIDQNLRGPTGGTAMIGYFFAWLQPGVLCIAYVLLRTRVVDARLVGARTIVYGALTAIPIGLFSIVDWLFARRLEDARLATIVEFVVAVLFGVGLNALHKRIDRFVDRIVFADRHHAFVRLRNATHALPSAERSATVYGLLANESAAALKLASAAVFVSSAGGFERVADAGWEEYARVLSDDDPIVLFARSQGRTVRLADFAASEAALPQGEGRPQIAIPLFVGHVMAGVAVYADHVSGEHLDADEEEHLAELVHAGGAALTRLASGDRIRQLEAQNALLLGNVVSVG
jgi:hypothetical protein